MGTVSMLDVNDAIKRERGNGEMILLFQVGYHLLSRGRSGVGVDIFRTESESQSESPEIRRLRSPVCDIFLNTMSGQNRDSVSVLCRHGYSFVM